MLPSIVRDHRISRFGAHLSVGSGGRTRPPTLVLFARSEMVTTLTAQIPICSPEYPNLRRARSRPVPMGLCAVSHWCEGCRDKGKARLSSALDRISERITLGFQTLSRPEAIRGSTSKNNNLPYISIRYGGGRGTGIEPSPRSPE